MLIDIIVIEPFTNQKAKTTTEGLSDLVWGLNWSLKAKGFLTSQDYKDIMANMLNIYIPESEGLEFCFIQTGKDDVFSRSKISGYYDEDNDEYVTCTKLLYNQDNLTFTL